MCFADISSKPVVAYFIFLMVTFEVPKFLILMKSGLSIF